MEVRQGTSRTRLVREFLEFLFPISCVGCGRVEEQRTAASDGARWFCAPCRADYQAGRGTCLVCTTRSPTGRTCYDCRPSTPLDGLVAVGSYRDAPLQDAVKRFKFSGIRALAEPLGDLLARRITAAGLIGGPSTILVPLPLHRRRERQRGYNQARLLAERIGAQLDLPIVDALVRSRAAAPQTSILGRGRARHENVAKAFALGPGISLPAGTRVIIVDDVATTGSTLTAAASTLRSLQPTELWAAVVTRG